MKMRKKAILALLALLAFIIPPRSSEAAGKVPIEEALSAANYIICKLAGDVTPDAAMSVFNNERMKYPQGDPVVLHFWVDGYVSKDQEGPKCLTRFEPHGGTRGSRTDFIFPSPTSGSIVSFQTTGLGKELPKNAQVRLAVQPGSLSIRPCQPAGLTATVTYEIDGKPETFDASSFNVQWSSSDPSGLAVLTGSADPGSIGAVGGGRVRHFEGKREGTYRVTASLGTVSAADLAAAALAGNPMAAQQIAQQLARSSASATVTVGKPTVSHIGVFPAFRELAPGETLPFTAQAAFAETCVKSRDVTSEAAWTPAGSNTFVAPVLSPTALTLSSDSHPSLEAEACETAQFSATLQFTSEEKLITATYGGVKGEARVRVKAPEPKKVTADPSIAWTSPSGGPSFAVNQTDPVTVSAAHGDSGVSAATVLKVKKPTIARVVIQPPQATLDVSHQKQFSAWAEYDQTCLKPTALSSSDGASWSTGSHGSVTPEGLFEASVPGKDTLVASLAGGPSGQAALTIRTPPLGIVPPKATLNLGEEQSFRAMLEPDTDVTNRDTTVWQSGPVFKAETCGTFPVSATYTDPETKEVRSKTANVVVKVDQSECVAIREALASSLSPDHLSESKRWLSRRQELIEMGCGNCGVEPTWTAGESESEEVSPPEGDVQPEGCSDARRETVKRASTDGGEEYSCGPCKGGFIPIRSGDGSLSCQTGDEIAGAASCPTATHGQFDPGSGRVGCCPANTTWNVSQNTCEGLSQPSSPGVDLTPVLIGIIGAGIASSIAERDRRRRQPEGTPKKKCHKRPDGTWHCGSG